MLDSQGESNAPQKTDPAPDGCPPSASGCNRHDIVGYLVSSLAIAQTTPCKQVQLNLDPPPETAMCLLSVDDRVVVNERCHVSISRDDRRYTINNGLHLTTVSARPASHGNYMLQWNGGTGPADRLLSFDTATEDSTRGKEVHCWKNRRIEMCISDFERCEPSK